MFKRDRDNNVSRSESSLGSYHIEEPSLEMPVSQLVTQGQIDSRTYANWCERIRERPVYRRKQWEFVYILQALRTAKMLSPDMMGLGFGVGREPLVAAIASFWCNITATDIDQDIATEIGWASTNEYALDMSQLNDRGICESGIFEECVDFRVVDMNEIPCNLKGYDFLWSSCSLEHLGTLQKGVKFIWNSLECLRPGGVAVHTTEYNLSSNLDTVEEGGGRFYIVVVTLLAWLMSLNSLDIRLR